MKDIYKNPTLYYILVPVLIGLWPLLTLFVHFPRAEKAWEKEKKQYNKAEKLMAEILTLDPERLDSANAQNGAGEFDYARVMESIASSVGIAATNYNVSSKPPRMTSGQKTKNATVILKEVDITKFAKFLSTIQLRWANLQCESVTLTSKKGLKDVWKVDLEFKYYY